VFTGEHTKPAENSAVLSGVLSAVSTSERSSEHSNHSILQSQQDLQTPKNAVEIKKEKMEQDAVRRASIVPLCKGASRFQKNQNLTARLITKIQDEGSFSDYIEECEKRGREHPFGDEEREAFAATKYEPDLNSPLLSFDFVMAVVDVYDKKRGKDISAGNLCSAIVDYCNEEIERGNGGYYPPDFVEHRNRLRENERATEQAERDSRAMRARTAPRPTA
jgi:hypothetical protein